jgi:hypothetical protein
MRTTRARANTEDMVHVPPALADFCSPRPAPTIPPPPISARRPASASRGGPRGALVLVVTLFGVVGAGAGWLARGAVAPRGSGPPVPAPAVRPAPAPPPAPGPPSIVVVFAEDYCPACLALEADLKRRRVSFAKRRASGPEYDAAARACSAPGTVPTMARSLHRRPVARARQRPAGVEREAGVHQALRGRARRPVRRRPVRPRCRFWWRRSTG